MKHLLLILTLLAIAPGVYSDNGLDRITGKIKVFDSIDRASGRAPYYDEIDRITGKGPSYNSNYYYQTKDSKVIILYCSDKSNYCQAEEVLR